MSQRDFAASLGISKSRLARLEQGKGLDTIALLERVLDAAGFRLVLVDTEADDWDPVYDSWQFRDRAGRRFPAHHVARPRKGMTRWE
jgi:HTH-type transcriptional regulator/antitoxin HipB